MDLAADSGRFASAPARAVPVRAVWTALVVRLAGVRVGVRAGSRALVGVLPLVGLVALILITAGCGPPS